MARNNNYNKKKNGQRKGGKNWQKNNSQDDAMIDEYNKGRRSVSPIEAKSADNDPSWYVARDVMAQNVASFPMGISTGLPVTIASDRTIEQTSIYSRSQIMPGIITLELAPFLGKCDEPSDPINVAMSALYTAMQINSSRNPQYQANDLTLYISAMSSAYSFYMWMTRLYGTLNNMSILNRYTPEALIQAQGGNYQDLKANLANFRAYINNFAYALASFYVPSDLDVVKRQKFVFENIYTDSDTAKAQYYLYKPAYFLKWVEGNPDSPTTYLMMATPKNTSSSDQTKLTPRLDNCTFADIYALGESIINPLRESEDIRIMAADMIKAFGVSTGFSVNPIADTYTVTPVYVKEVLMQFENAYVPWLPTKMAVVIEANPEINMSNSINQKVAGEVLEDDWNVFNFIDMTNHGTDPQIDWPSNISKVLASKIIVNFHTDSISADDFLVATRLSRNPIDENSRYSGTGADVSGAVLNYKYGGTEICVGGYITYYGEDRFLHRQKICSEYLVLTQKASTTTSSLTVQNMLELLHRNVFSWKLTSAFDWYPKYHLIENFSDSAQYKLNVGSYAFDIDNWTMITAEEWDRMNFQAMLGLYECALGETPKLR